MGHYLFYTIFLKVQTQRSNIKKSKAKQPKLKDL